MSGVWGNKIKFSIFGESHGNAIGGVISSLPAGFKIDFEMIDFELKRRNHRAVYSTPRNEADNYEILSGVFEGKTTGSPLAFMIKNNDTKSKHYDDLKSKMRPGHSDYPAYIKYSGFNDVRGGGHFSGRLTAPLVFAGAIAKQILLSQGIKICSHLLSIGSVKGESLLGKDIDNETVLRLNSSMLAVLDENLKEKMMDEITKYQSDGNSIGGVIECVALGIPAGVGDPFFDSMESRLSSMMFSIPAVKGIEFGMGFDITKMSGYDANDSYYYDNNLVKTHTNNNGGITGGITNGMPVCFKVAIKPTPSVSKQQDTIDVINKCNTKVEVKGRHDACIVPRAAVAVECAAALTILDMIKEG